MCVCVFNVPPTAKVIMETGPLLNVSSDRLVKPGSEPVLFVLLLYVPSQQLWSLRDGQFTYTHFFLGRLEQAVNQ